MTDDTQPTEAVWGPPPPAPGLADGGHEVSTAPVRSRARRYTKVAVGVGAAFGLSMGATVLAAAATSPTSPTSPQAARSSASTNNGTNNSSGSSANPGGPPGGGQGGLGFGGPGLGAGPGLGGPVIHGQYTVKSPSGGYETLEEQAGTVSSITNTSGSNWTLVVMSADNTSITYTVDSGTSIDGGETGVSGIAKGDAVHVVAVEDNGTAEAKNISDSTVLKANGQSWMSQPPAAPSGSSSGSSSSG